VLISPKKVVLKYFKTGIKNAKNFKADFKSGEKVLKLFTQKSYGNPTSLMTNVLIMNKNGKLA
jgi:hypothetical protein